MPPYESWQDESYSNEADDKLVISKALHTLLSGEPPSNQNQRPTRKIIINTIVLSGSRNKKKLGDHKVISNINDTCSLNIQPEGNGK